MLIPNWLVQVTKENKALDQIQKKKSPIAISSVIQEALLIVLSYKQKPRPIIVLKSNLYLAQQFYERLTSFLSDEECSLFGTDESLRMEAIASSPELSAQQVDTLSSLQKHPNQIVVTCPSAYLRFLPLPSQFQEVSIHLKVNEEYSMNDLKEKLLASGYHQQSHIDQPLSFAIRGGIVDVYSINYDHPIRLEFFDTEIESIRFFDENSQKTIGTIQEVEIVPASIVFFSKDQIQEIKENIQQDLNNNPNVFLQDELRNTLEAMDAYLFDKSMYPYYAFVSKVAGLWDYMNQAELFISDEILVRDAIKRLKEDTISYIQEMAQENKLLPRFALWHDLERSVPKVRCYYGDSYGDNIAHIEEVYLPNEPLEKRIQIAQRQMTTIFVLNKKEMQRVCEILNQEKADYQFLKGKDELGQASLYLYEADWSQGFFLADKNVAVYTARELLEVHHRKGRYENKFRNAEVIHAYQELEPGDYVVHAHYGVGQYLGIETKEIKHIKRDFLRIIYRANSELLVPLEQFRLVRKFVSREGVVPKLNKLGSGDWEKTKAKLQKNVEEIAGRLLDLYSAREQHIGYAFSKDTEETKRFEDAFPYDLTIDQERAMVEIKKDMESNKPMDRLICGDVGFGKTEVSIRASFKAVTDYKQVVVLCPTTILAEQHFSTFKNRYKDFAVRIEILDRFVPKNKQKEIVEDLAKGKVDILIGTHRVLSKDIHFKDLGLLIIDEEQRFGVEHKEKIKELRNGVDVLALSATPIPRTLQMSLIGVRSLSQLETPPLNRYSVQTYVVEKNQALIVDAIQKELSRKGQVFYLYNNIEFIYNKARTLQKELPDARIGVVHGQLGREEIEDIMWRFHNKEIDVLVTTTIIENGIDIPNVNTIFIEDAQNFGLSQIYQMKGRVGRSNRLAYAYLLIPTRKQLSEIAQKRLQAIKEFAKLGSGYKVAMRDLTIRGAGDLLGSSQSGFIDTVGIDMYIEMLEMAIEAKKNNQVVEKKEAKVKNNIQVSSYIPKGFAADDFDKLDLYQRIDALRTSEELMEYKVEIRDQYGRLPKEVETIFDKKELDLALSQAHVQHYLETVKGKEITFSPLFSQSVDGVKLFSLYSELSKDIQLKYLNRAITVIVPNNESLKVCTKAIYLAKEAIRHES
ncbi:transcription-repair coupling factor [Bulleidia sp. zg-1006]|uniref:transcription-repair coupling factor n=1 Tax=Bulleidia sp. zg-1006 TaxID=2806552 RepID=UPI001EED9A11|nr:transcription-repair coupling factor [Bulleidia sp. zg-1006]